MPKVLTCILQAYGTRIAAWDQQGAIGTSPLTLLTSRLDRDHHRRHRRSYHRCYP